MNLVKYALTICFIYGIANCLSLAIKSYMLGFHLEAVVWLMAAVLSGLCAYGTTPKDEE